MKALSIQQPWPWAIFNGKDIENRTWPTRFTGPFLIHVGKKFGEAIIEMVHLMYQNRTALKFLNALHDKIYEEIERRQFEIWNRG